MADPITLDAALIAQAQRTDAGIIFSSMERPVGNGIPIAKPTGAINATAQRTLTANGRATPLSTMGVSTAEALQWRRQCHQHAAESLHFAPYQVFTVQLPAPLEISMEKMMTVSA